MPDNGPRIGSAIREMVATRSRWSTPPAWKRPWRPPAVWAQPSGGVVLLSPAAPSFGRFTDYRERARAFAEAAAAGAGL